ncbi:MAG: hypothetical protein R3C19_23260 [Planctomycetaceae bacterium]
MLKAATGRTTMTPFSGVELTGWGYYIERTWTSIHDDLYATALAAESDDGAAIVIALDLMVIDERFTRLTRQLIGDATGIPAKSILLTCSHSHNAPAAGGLLGVGECSRKYEDQAAQLAADAAIQAWNSRTPARVRCGSTIVSDLSYNRTRANGITDSTLTAALFERRDGKPLAAIVNFGAHPTVTTELRPRDVSRDVPGRVCDLIEQHFPGATAMYIQGACGDTNFLPEFQTVERCDEPAQRLASAAVESLRAAAIQSRDSVATDSRIARLPTRRWLRDEIDHDRNEAKRRLREEDFSNWRQTIGRCMTNRPDDMVARHGGDEAKAVKAMCRFQLEWTDRMLRDLDSRPEHLLTEVQAIRIGPLTIAANACEFFSPFARDVRHQSRAETLMLACYSNGRIGYLPDAHDIDAKSYAGYQSPKYCNQFPFTKESGPAMCRAMLDSIEAVCQGT